MNQTIETRSTTIAKEVDRAVGPGTGFKWDVYALLVKKHYEGTYPRQMRRVNTDGINAQTIKRWLELGGHAPSTSKLPDDMEESLVAALPEDNRRELTRSLARRYGLLGVDMSHGSGSNVLCLERLVHEFGEAVQEMAPCLGGDATADQLDSAIKELTDLEAVACQKRQKLQREREERFGVVRMPTVPRAYQPSTAIGE